MAKQETILSRKECAAEFNLSEQMLEHYLNAGDIRHWTDGEGNSTRHHIPRSAAEAVLAPFLTALRSEEIQTLTGLSNSAISSAIKRGAVRSLRPSTYDGEKITIYVAREEFERWQADRLRHKENGAIRRAGAQPASAAAIEKAVAQDRERQRAGVPAEDPPTLSTRELGSALAGQIAGLAQCVSELQQSVKASRGYIGDLAEAVRDLTEAAAADRAERAALRTVLEYQNKALSEFAAQVGNLGHWLGEAVVQQASKDKA